MTAPQPNADFEFLNPPARPAPSFLHEDPWRVFRVLSDMVGGIETMARALNGITRVVAVFGSARTPETHPYYAQARSICRTLGENGFTILTGGGPGLMEAANRGARDAGALSIGLNIQLPHEQHLNRFLDVDYECRYFFVRKMLFAKYASAFLIFPGGFGTLDEMFEALTLIQTEKLADFPVILVGSRYWNPLVTWMRDAMAAEGCISHLDLSSFAVTDDGAAVLRWLVQCDEEQCHLSGGIRTMITTEDVRDRPAD